MQTVLTWPDGWSAAAHQEGDLTVYTLAPTLRVEVDPLLPMADDLRAWAERVLHRHLPAGGTVEVADRVDALTDRGWPMTIITSVIRDGGAHPLEGRLSAFYEFLYHGSAVVCRATDRLRFEDVRRQWLEQVLRHAAPDFASRDVARIDDLFEL